MYNIDTYLDIDKIEQGYSEICIFGTGKLGTGNSYEFLKCAGVRVDFFCDNNIGEEIEVIDGIKSKPVQYLYDNKDHIFCFVCISEKYSREIEEQFERYQITNYAFVNWFTIAFVLDSLINANDEIKNKFQLFYNDEEFIRYEYKKYHGYEPDLVNPKRFNEKLQWLKLYNYNAEYTKYVDKLKFKEYVSDVIGKQYVIPLLGVWERYEEIDFDKLPQKFVLKCTHDSGSIVIVDDKSNIDHDKAKQYLNSRLMINYYWMGREYPYRSAQRMIIAEPYIKDDYGELRDYKVFCFHGKAKYVQVDFDRFKDHKRNIYDLEWNYIPLEIKFTTSPDTIIEKPICLQEMLEIAEKLAKEIIHVRVDFYVVHGKPIVGEMTFFHGGGMEKFTPEEWNYTFGEQIHLPDKVI